MTGLVDDEDGLHDPSSIDAFSVRLSAASATRRRTICEQASTSSITKMAWEKESCVEARGPPPITSRFRSYMISASCWLVSICAREIFMSTSLE